MDPQQELFTELFLKLSELGYDVYDGRLPPEKTPYPFIYLGDVTQSDQDTKNQIIGTVSPTIHVWHNETGQRGTVSEMLYQIKTVCRNLEHTDHYAWSVKIKTQTILPDNTTAEPLLHGVLTPEFTFT